MPTVTGELTLEMFGDALVEHGLITPRQRDWALETTKRTGTRLTVVLISSGIVRRLDLYGVLAELSHLPFIDSFWFDYMLPGLDALRLPIPLGGTSNHFRADGLRRLGGWDPFNVTEDADLGIRASALGYTVGVVNSTTYEEANRKLGNWIRQRSRWVKGYMQTSLVHARNPWALVRVAGLRQTLGFALLIEGTPLTFLFVRGPPDVVLLLGADRPVDQPRVPRRRGVPFFEFASYGQTYGGFVAGLALAASYTADPGALLYALVMCLFVPLLGSERFQGDWHGPVGTCAVIAFPVVATAACLSFLVWKITGHWPGDLHYAPYADLFGFPHGVLGGIGPALATAFGDLARSAVYIAVAVLLCVRRGTVRVGVGLLLPAFALALALWLGLDYSSINAFYLFTLLAIAVVTDHDLLGSDVCRTVIVIAAVAQVIIGIRLLPPTPGYTVWQHLMFQ